MAKSRAVKLGIVGVGKVANVCAKAIGSIDTIELRSACNHTRMRLQEFCQNFHLNGYLNLPEMIVNENLNAILICTPVPTHMYYAEIASNYDCHILCQAPISLSSPDIDYLLDYRRRTNKVVEELDCHYGGSYLRALSHKLKRLQEGRKDPGELKCTIAYNDLDSLYIMLLSLCYATGCPSLEVTGQEALLIHGRIRIRCSFNKDPHNFIELEKPFCREFFEDHLLGFDDLYNLTHVDPSYFDQKKLNQSILDYHNQIKLWSKKMKKGNQDEPYLGLASELTDLIGTFGEA